MKQEQFFLEISKAFGETWDEGFIFKLQSD